MQLDDNPCRWSSNPHRSTYYTPTRPCRRTRNHLPHSRRPYPLHLRYNHQWAIEVGCRRLRTNQAGNHTLHCANNRLNHGLRRFHEPLWHFQPQFSKQSGDSTTCKFRCCIDCFFVCASTCTITLSSRIPRGYDTILYHTPRISTMTALPSIQPKSVYPIKKQWSSSFLPTYWQW